MDVFEHGEEDDDEFDDGGGESRARLERTTRRRRRGSRDDALGLEERALFDDGVDGNDAKKKKRKRRVSIQLRARFEGHDAPFRCG